MNMDHRDLHPCGKGTLNVFVTDFPRHYACETRMAWEWTPHEHHLASDSRDFHQMRNNLGNAAQMVTSMVEEDFYHKWFVPETGAAGVDPYNDRLETWYDLNLAEDFSC